MNCRFPHKTINQELNWNCRLPNSSCWSPLKLSIAKFKLLIITWTVDWYLKLLIITWTVHCYLEVLGHYLNCRLPNSSSRSLLELSIAKFKLSITTWTVDFHIKLSISTWTVDYQIKVFDHHLNCRLPNSSYWSGLQLSIANKSCWSLLKLSIDKFKLLITTLTVDCQIQVVAHHLNCRLQLKTVDHHLNCRLLPRSSRSPLKLSIAKFKLLLITWTVDFHIKLSITTWTVDCQIQVVDHHLNCRLVFKTVDHHLYCRLFLNCRFPNKSSWSPLKPLELSIST